MKKKIIIIVFILLIFLSLVCYILLKRGHNINIKSADNNILNMVSYSANVEITIYSNKNTNTYKATQKYDSIANIYIQEILEPQNISGTIIKYEKNNLSITNTKLNLTTIYENYNNISSYDLNLLDFINDYKNSNFVKNYEQNDEIIYEIEIMNENECIRRKILKTNKQSNKPISLEIKDISNRAKIYILYNEIEIK